MDINQFSEKENIVIKGARVNNLKNISLAIPRNKLIVITGVSGSGKSSLAFDTLYAEGQRRYVESLSSYARQFLGRMDKPDVDYIKGITPAIAIEQKVSSRNPRSTVGTATEIYDYLKLLYARIGQTVSPISGKVVKKHTVTDVVESLYSIPEGTRIAIAAPLFVYQDRTLDEQLKILVQQGFSRVIYNGKLMLIEELISEVDKINVDKLKLIIDRLTIKHNDSDWEVRVADSIQTAFYEGKDNCIVIYWLDEEPSELSFSALFEADGMVFEEPSTDLFSFNSPFGACPTCEGFGSVVGIDEDLVVPNKSLSVYDDAIVCWRGEKMGEFKTQLIKNAKKFDFPIHKPYFELTPEQKKLLWKGNEHFTGIYPFFKELEANSYKIQYRVMLARYRGKTVCPDCEGGRLRKQALNVKVANMSIADLSIMPIHDLGMFFESLQLSKHDIAISKRIILEITSRLQFMNDVGLGYLTISRIASTLSGGESQRMNLAKSLGSSLVGSTYILDEPSIGLHSRDTGKLIKILKQLRDLGNTVIVVEHDDEIIRSADYIIDIGPYAGTNGGEIMFNGTYQELLKDKVSLTGKYINKLNVVKFDSYLRPFKNYIELKGAHENNLKNIDVKFPLNMLTIITGVSGSGKSTLVNKILYPALKRLLSGYSDKVGAHVSIDGDVNTIKDVELIDQNPIGRSSRSNPVTYIKAFDEIRELFAMQQISKIRGYKPGIFSFNVPGGRCDECEGEGIVKIEMQFMADVHLQCESCKGARYKEDILDVKYNGKNISEILNMTIQEAIVFFSEDKKYANLTSKIIDKLKPLIDVGLGYLHMGQSSSTLSGGEAQRVKLASFLVKGARAEKMLFIFDEPTTGLHFHDIERLVKSFNELIKYGHSIIIIEHNTQVIRAADWIIDLGPEGGDKGGYVVFEGRPQELKNCIESYTSKVLQDI